MAKQTQGSKPSPASEKTVNENDTVIIKAKRWVNTSNFGNAAPGQNLKVPKVFADALVESGEAEIIDEE